MPHYNDSNILHVLASTPPADKDDLPFGIIGFDENFIVREYNKTESNKSGLSSDTVIGSHIFTEVAPCMNNYMVALKFETEKELDEDIPYILSFRMAPTHVRLRLLKNPQLKLSYILVKWNDD